MDPVRALTRTSLLSLAGGLVLLTGGLSGLAPTWSWYTAHGAWLLLGFVLPALAALHAHTLQVLARTTFDAPRVAIAANLWLVGAAITALAILMPAAPFLYGELLGTAALIGGATIWSVQVMKHAPKKGLVDMDADKLTKGDDACLKHVHFAHRFLPIGLILLFAGIAVGGLWGGRIETAGIHIVVVGYGLLSMYGISHFWVPRLSGIPAIAAGAIKGELHTSLLGIVGITVGFILGFDTSIGRGFLVGLGPMVFLGFFVWMGVLGANIMKNKSPTNSVRPEFVYIPWVFSAVFWAVTAVLMGIFLNVLPDTMAERFPALRFTHLHSGLLGGAIQLLMGLGVRLLPMHVGGQPPRFDSGMKGSFYLFNAGIAVAAYGSFIADDRWIAGALAAIVLSFAMYALALRGYMRPAQRSSAVPE